MFVLRVKIPTIKVLLARATISATAITATTTAATATTAAATVPTTAAPTTTRSPTSWHGTGILYSDICRAFTVNRELHPMRYEEGAAHIGGGSLINSKFNLLQAMSMWLNKLLILQRKLAVIKIRKYQMVI
jgi:hypothetical protein